MTTTILEGYRFDYDGFDFPQRGTPSTLTVIGSEGLMPEFRVVGLLPSDYGSVFELALIPAEGAAYQVTTSGIGLDGDTLIMGGTFHWGDGKQTQIIAFNFMDGSADRDFEFMMHVGGDPLPDLRSASELSSWLTTLNRLSTDLGALAPGRAFDLGDLPSFVGTRQNDVLLGNPEFDDWSGMIVDTGRGHDRVRGMAGDEHFRLGSGNDQGRGAGGDDRIEGQSGHDRLFGGTGDDTLLGQRGHDRLSGQKGNDLLRGGTGYDTLSGLGGSDTLRGDIGNDALYGGTSRDFLWGGAGADTLDGGRGHDVLTGGSGADEFVYATGGGRDRIRDFEDGVDTLALSVPAANAAAALDFARDTTNGVLIEFDDGGRVVVLGMTKASLADDIVLI